MIENMLVERRSKDYVIRVSASFYDFLVEKQKQFYEKYKKRISFVQLTDMIAKLLWNSGEAEIIAIKPKLRSRRKFVELEGYDFFKFKF
jgi:hypothetical protein